jgi:hypothetical protein
MPPPLAANGAFTARLVLISVVAALVCVFFDLFLLSPAPFAEEGMRGCVVVFRCLLLSGFGLAAGGVVMVVWRAGRSITVLITHITTTK